MQWTGHSVKLKANAELSFRIDSLLNDKKFTEAVIGHMKSDGHLGRCCLKGQVGDAANAILTAAGYNFRLLR